MSDQDYSKRGYLLPEGCKDLMDVINLQKSPKLVGHVRAEKIETPPVTRQIAVREAMSVSDFAPLLRQRPFQILADLMGFGVFASLNHVLDFETMQKLARKYGYEAKRSA